MKKILNEISPNIIIHVFNSTDLNWESKNAPLFTLQHPRRREFFKLKSLKIYKRGKIYLRENLSSKAGIKLVISNFENPVR